MNIQQDILRISLAVAFALISIVLIGLAVKGASNLRKKKVMFIFAGIFLSVSVFTASLIVESVEFSNILKSIAIISISVSSGFTTAHVIGEYRRKRSD